jgi:hypothetical protein
MEDLVSNGRIVKFRVESGRYLPSQQKVSKSRISSSNGGGFTHRGSGSVNAAKNKSTTATEQAIWLLAGSGHQVPVRLSGDTKSVHVDQETSVLQARHPTRDAHVPVGIVNHSAVTTNWPLVPLILAQRTGLVGWARAVIMALLSFLLVGGVTGGTAWGLIPATVILCRNHETEKAILLALAQLQGCLGRSLHAHPSTTA